MTNQHNYLNDLDSEIISQKFNSEKEYTESECAELFKEEIDALRQIDIIRTSWPFDVYSDDVVERKDVATEIAKEMHDFQMIIQHCSEAYIAMSNGQISKPNTLPQEAIWLMEEFIQKERNEAFEEGRQSVLDDLSSK